MHLCLARLLEKWYHTQVLELSFSNRSSGARIRFYVLRVARGQLLASVLPSIRFLFVLIRDSPEIPLGC